jgi:hypothetical protein
VNEQKVTSLTSEEKKITVSLHLYEEWLEQKQGITEAKEVIKEGGHR